MGNLAQAFGWIATTLLTVCAVPQFVKICYSKSVKDISSWMWWLFLLGHLFAITYAILIGQTPLVTKYAVNIVISVSILLAYYRYRS